FFQPLVEDLVEAMAQLLRDSEKMGLSSISHVLFPGTFFGRDIMARLAARFNSESFTDIREIIDANHVSRAVFAGNILLSLKLDHFPAFLSVRISAFSALLAEKSEPSPVTVFAPDLPDVVTVFKDFKVSEQARPDLATAKIVVAGGGGCVNEAGFQRVLDLADVLGAAVGATRTAVDLGLAPGDWQIGQTGRLIGPDLYIAVGISGAVQHLAGIKDARVIVSINKDAEAQIHHFADYALVADLNEAIPALIQQVKGG
ncbi:electron transfer flavoprotein subunit alpha/FixB family protein, partial [Magnetococcales bacterium HHB-1]